MLYLVIGLMSGTSLDGLDIAFCSFEKSEDAWKYRILKAETIPYSETWRNRLASLERGSPLDFVTTDVEYGHLLGRLTREFMERYQVQPDFIASHGHTIFHQPRLKLTVQIGRGSAIAAETGCPVVSDFRSLDVALGGQGAPLVPIGDHLLFEHYDFCLNLGGFANISYEKDGKRIAFDICPVNTVLNTLAEKLGEKFDRDGLFASQGNVIPGLFEKLNALPFYAQQPPRSMGKEWVLDQIAPLINIYAPGIGFLNSDPDPSIPVTLTREQIYDLLATWCEHTAYQISQAVSGNQAYTQPGMKAGREPSVKPIGKWHEYEKRSDALFITGGGAFNGFLVKRIRHNTGMEIILPDEKIINYKEALIFAFLGVLRWRNEINCLQSVTGASRDSSGGSIY